MIEVKTNYKNMFVDTICRKCNNEEENLSHVIQCNRGIPHDENLEHICSIVENIEEEDENTTRSIAKVIHTTIEEMKMMVLVPTLESEPMATSIDGDTY